MRNIGQYQRLGSHRHFVPAPLPPTAPPFEITPQISHLLGEANFALGKLNTVGSNLPDAKRFIKAYAIKEALLSSAIEGIHTTLVETLSSEAGKTKPSKDSQLVLNYSYALAAALEMMQQHNLPLAIRVILKAHQVLLSDGDNDNKTPGQFRQQTVKVGELTPAPATDIPALMSELERYINQPCDLPPLIRAGLVHAQFEIIHPFLDGNGRIGRLLIILMLIRDGSLNAPVLYPSYYLKQHHLEYYLRLDKIRTEGGFEGWIEYYLKAIRDSANDAYQRAQDIEQLDAQLQQLIKTSASLTKNQATAFTLLNHLFEQPITTITTSSHAINTSYNTAAKLLGLFRQLNIVSEYSANKGSRTYQFTAYLELLEKSYADS